MERTSTGAPTTSGGTKYRDYQCVQCEVEFRAELDWKPKHFCPRCETIHTKSRHKRRDYFEGD